MNFHPLLAAEDLAPVMFIIGIYGILGAIIFTVTLIVSAVICFLVSQSLAKVPAVHRKMEPAMVWLLMIPCFGIVWNFFVFQRVPDSFQSYFASVGRRDLGDCGKGIGLAYSICVATSIIPFVNYLTGLASLVLLVLCLVRFHELAGQIGVTAAWPLAPASPPPPPTIPPAAPPVA